MTTSSITVPTDPIAPRGAAPIRGHAGPRVVRSLARFTVLEAWRSRWLAAAMLMAGAVGAVMLFTGEMALTEQGSVALSLAAPLARLAAVLLVATFAVSVLARELNDGSIELVLSAPVSRLTWVFGRWMGLAGVALGTAVAAALPLALQAPPAALVAWTVSLWLELCLVAGVALLLAISFAQVPAALLSLLAFYAMARLAGVLVLLNSRAPLEAPAVVAQLGDLLLGMLAHLLPRLDLFTRTDWLLGGAGAPAGLGLGAVQLALWLVLVPAVAWLDFAKRRG
jgi:ABC-type transport system involved in multi-copper enzyme maturation permease subunit